MRPKGYQLLHKEDNGELVVCELEGQLEIVCKKCRQRWMLPGPYALGKPDDFVRYEPTLKSMTKDK